MNDLFGAAEQIQDFIDAAGWHFCFIGGLAVQRWGEPRLTRDVDLTLLVNFGDEDAVITPLVARFEGRIPDVSEFARANRVLLLRSDSGVALDIALGALDFERRAVERSSAWQVAGVTALRTCSAEDLVVHKVFAGRDRDWADVAGVVDRYGSALDAVLIRSELEPLLELKDDRVGMLRLDALLAGETPP